MEIDKGFCDNEKWNTLNGPYGQGSSGKSPLVRGTQAMRDVADALSSVQVATVTSVDAPAAAGSYTQADIQKMLDLINEMKTKLNAIAAATLKTTKV